MSRSPQLASSFLERIGINPPPPKITEKFGVKTLPGKGSHGETFASSIASKLGPVLTVTNYLKNAMAERFLHESPAGEPEGLGDLVAAGEFLDDPHKLSCRHAHARIAREESQGTAYEQRAVTCGKDASEALVKLCVGPSILHEPRGPSTDAMGYPNPCAIGGDQRLKLIRDLLDEYKWERQDNQIQFHELMIKTFLPSIFAKEWDTQYDRILRSLGLHDHCAESLVVCPRRFGKTVSVAMMAAVLFFCVPAADIAIFSTGKRTAYKMMYAVYEFMKEIPYFKDAIFTTRNSETIICELYGDVKKMAAYPGTVAVSLDI